MPCLFHRLENTRSEATLVRRSTNWFEDGVNWNIITFFVQAYQTKWQSISTCLVLSWTTRFWASIDSRLIITVHRHGPRLPETKLHQEIFWPHHLAWHMSHNSILSFCTRVRHNILLFTPPNHQIFFNKGAIPSSRLSVSSVTSISWIRIFRNTYMPCFLYTYPFPGQLLM